MTDTYNLNQGQQKASEEILDFLLSDRPDHRISGPGGVGKTYLMGYTIDHILPAYEAACRTLGIEPLYTEVALTATTNKAADALAQATGRFCSTIHSFLGLVVKPDFKTGEQKLVRSRKWRIVKNTVIFIDEASMMDSQLMRELEASTLNCKLIYLGDHVQLKPVKESISPVYAGDNPCSLLLEPMRTSIPALHALNQQMRDTVEQCGTNPDNLYSSFRPIKEVPGIIDFVDGPTFRQLVHDTFAHQNKDDRILAYTNQRVLDYNAYIRTHVRNLPQTLTVGELLVNNNAAQLSQGMIPVEAGVEVLKVHGTDTVRIGTDIQFDVLMLDILTIGGVFTDVPVPTDRAYFNKLIKFFQSQKDWPTYFALKEGYPDLREREAATVHKSQGSSYNTVFIDAADLSTCTVPDTMARLLYVAVSRARKRVVIYGELASKYGGLIR